MFFMVIVTFSFYSNIKSGIRGTIDPIDGAKKVWAISGVDSNAVIPVAGKFSIDVKPGNYKVVVEGVLVLENQPTDVGVIKLLND